VSEPLVKGAEVAASLREAFDRSFAVEAAGERRATLDFLDVRLGSDPFAIRLSDLAGMFADRKVTPVPTSVPEFRGVAGFRGALVPVYDLAALAGYPPAETNRWLLLAQGGAVAFAVDTFDGHFRIDAEAIAKREGEGPSSQLVREIARRGERAWPIIDIQAAIASVRRHAPNSHASKE
jgi:purine-binding chemotaxis protein CheW